ncbi:MAG: hypothetical protein FWD73_08245 [Polyangiaceae bacterium]|nr:hypothetical protein [Polyangiaceae bacterium]
MTHLNMTLWKIIVALALQIPFSKQKVETVLKAQVFETDNTANDQLHSYKSQPVKLADGVIISTIDLRIKRVGKDPGDLGLKIDGTCITREQLEARYKYLQLVGIPHGHSLEEQTVYAQDMPWGSLTFGFKERKPACLASVGFGPKKND